MKKTHATIVFTADPHHYVETYQSGDEELVKQFSDTLGIDTVRSLIEEAHRTPTQAVAKCIVVGGGNITVEAQNSFLKVLEEPPASSRFLVVLPAGTSVLPTIASRVVFQSDTEGAAASSELFDQWQQCTYKDRLAAVDAAIKNKDIAWQRTIKQGLVHYLNKPQTAAGQTLRALQFVAQHLLTRGASNKFLLEELALSLPLTEANRK